jgi:hypothetical protein
VNAWSILVPKPKWKQGQKVGVEGQEIWALGCFPILLTTAHGLPPFCYTGYVNKL